MMNQHSPSAQHRQKQRCGRVEEDGDDEVLVEGRMSLFAATVLSAVAIRLPCSAAAVETRRKKLLVVVAAAGHDGDEIG